LKNSHQQPPRSPRHASFFLDLSLSLIADSAPVLPVSRAFVGYDRGDRS
jgi:hypothetical protein